MQNGYPTEEELQAIKGVNCLQVGLEGMVKLISEAWNHCYGRLAFDGEELSLVTGGWSGNEEVIIALMENAAFWALFWDRSERGGRFWFKKSQYAVE